MSAPVRVLVADDSPTARAFLQDLLDDHPGLVVVGAARDGEEAVRLTAELQPSIVVMDALMPGLDGFAATKQIMQETPTPVVVVSATVSPDDVAVALRAVEVGALTVLPKPAMDTPSGARAARALARKILVLASVRVIRRYDHPTTRSRPVAPVIPTVPHAAVRIVAMAASTGGPGPVRDILGMLPGDLPAPVVLVQHIAAGFVEGFVRWLDTGTDLEVRLAADNEVLQAGRVYVAPDDRHLRVTAGQTIQLGQDPRIGGFRPSATALYESVAAVYGQHAVGVILSGLGDDGLAGLLGLSASGGIVLAQDEQSSAIFGMPGVVAASGIADAVESPERLAARIRELMKVANG